MIQIKVINNIYYRCYRLQQTQTHFCQTNAIVSWQVFRVLIRLMSQGKMCSFLLVSLKRSQSEAIFQSFPWTNSFRMALLIATNDTSTTLLVCLSSSTTTKCIIQLMFASLTFPFLPFQMKHSNWIPFWNRFSFWAQCRNEFSSRHPKIGRANWLNRTIQ